MFRLYNALFLFFEIQWTNAPPAGAGCASGVGTVRPSLGLGLTWRSLGCSLRGNVIPRFGFSCFGGLNGSTPTKTLCVLNLAKVLHKFFFKVAAAKILKRCFWSVSSARAALHREKPNFSPPTQNSLGARTPATFGVFGFLRSKPVLSPFPL